MSTCFRCGRDYSSPHEQYLCDACLKALGWDLPSKTNAQYIRSMTDEELVRHMMQLNFCPPNISAYKVCGENANCYQCWLDWLKQPYKEESNG